jgi:ligand-binding sensor domain-containing protein
MRHTPLHLFVAFVLVVLQVPCLAQGDFWIGASGPFGGLIEALAVDSAGTVLAGTSRGGMFRSTDQGQTWSPANAGLGSSKVSTIAVHRSGTWFAALRGAPVCRSTNQGTTWINANAGLGSTLVEAFACGDAVIFAAGNYGVYASADTGRSWTDISNALSGVRVRCLALEPGGGLLAGTPRGMFYSTDQGITWEQRNSGLASDTSALQVAIAQGSEILIGTSQSQGVYRSIDHGLSWTKKSTGISTGYNAAMMISPAGIAFVSIQHVGLFRSTDLGDSWSPVTSGPLQNNVTALSYSGQGDLYAGEFGGGVSRSTDAGLSWVRAIQGMSASSTKGLAHSTSGLLYAATIGTGMHRSTDDGRTWHEVGTGLANVETYSTAVSSGNTVYAGTFGDGVFRSDDDGMTWSRKANGMGNTEVYAFLTIGADTVIAGCRNAGVFITTDRGENWVPSNSGFPTYVTVHCLAKLDTMSIAAATSPGGVYISTDAGSHWQQRSNGLPTTEVRAVAAGSPTMLFAGTDGDGIFRSTDAGDTWQLAEVAQENIVHAILSTPDGRLFMGGNNGAHLSTDNGDSWTDIVTGMNSTVVKCFDISPSGTLLAGTEGTGVFYSANPVSVREQTAGTLPSTPYLAHNYPNPFNPTTVVRYQLPAASEVKLVVCDLLGREVGVLVNEKKGPGTYEVTLDGSGLASGVYFCRLTAGNYVQSRKMIVVR